MSIIITFVWQIPNSQTSLHVIQSTVGVVQTLEYSWTYHLRPCLTEQPPIQNTKSLPVKAL